MNLTMEHSAVRVRVRVAQRLALDLERIRIGTGPTAEELAMAPLLDEWAVAPIVVTGLRGRLEGLQGNATTTELFVLDPVAGYCRTFSRLYRLGRGVQ